MSGLEDGTNGPGGDRVERLLRRAGPRPAAPEPSAARVLRVVEREWDAAMRRRSTKRRRAWTVAAALAASVALGLLTVPLLRTARAPVVSSVALTILEMRTGTVRVGDAPGVADDALAAGTRIESGADGRAALRMSGGQSVRMDVGTTLRLESPDAVVLERGAVYVDSGSDADRAGRPLIVRAPQAEIRDIGTQFVVALEASRLLVRVREGRVQLRDDRGTHTADEGVELTRGPAGEISRRSILSHGPEWEWVGEIAPAPAIEGRPLREFLDWVARETGRPVVFDGAEVAERSEEIVLRGTIDGLRPEKALDAVLRTCGLRWSLESGRFVIGSAREDGAGG